MVLGLRQEAPQELLLSYLLQGNLSTHTDAEPSDCPNIPPSLDLPDAMSFWSIFRWLPYDTPTIITRWDLGVTMPGALKGHSTCSAWLGLISSQSEGFRQALECVRGTWQGPKRLSPNQHKG